MKDIDQKQEKVHMNHHILGKSHHVIPNPDGGWNVKKGRATRASKHFETKKEAISWGREVSRKQGSELVIHKKDGTIERKDSHGNDPLPPRDRK